MAETIVEVWSCINFISYGDHINKVLGVRLGDGRGFRLTLVVYSLVLLHTFVFKRHDFNILFVKIGLVRSTKRIDEGFGFVEFSNSNLEVSCSSPNTLCIFVSLFVFGLGQLEVCHCEEVFRVVPENVREFTGVERAQIRVNLV